jgi:hypothetical protein
MSETAQERTRALWTLALVLPLVLYGAWAAAFIRAGVGYEMDEALWTESAVYLLKGSGTPPFGHDPASWITLFGRRLPLMILPYEGSTKAFATLPFFAAFGIRTAVARAASVLLGAIGIVGLVTLVGRTIGAAAALLLGILLAVHPSYLDLTVFDNGGTAVWMAAMGIIALALSHHLRRPSARSALWLGVAAGVGVWARANVLWLIAASVAAGLLVFGRRAIPPLRHVAAMLGGGILGTLPLIVYEIASRFGTLRFIDATRQPLGCALFEHRLRDLADVMLSDREQKIVWGGAQLPSWTLAFGAATLVVILLVAIRPAATPPARWRRTFALTALFLAAIILSSRLNIQQHHHVAVLPLAVAVIVALGAGSASRRRAIVPWLAVLAAGFLTFALVENLRIRRGLERTGGKRVFSSAIEDLRGELEAHPVPPDRLKILNWGFQNPLYVISGGSLHGTELYWGATRERSRRGLTWDQEIRDGGSFLLYAFVMGPPDLSDGAAGFEEALRRYDGPKTVRILRDRTGEDWARLITIEPSR